VIFTGQHRPSHSREDQEIFGEARPHLFWWSWDAYIQTNGERLLPKVPQICGLSEPEEHSQETNVDQLYWWQLFHWKKVS